MRGEIAVGMQNTKNMIVRSENSRILGNMYFFKIKNY